MYQYICGAGFLLLSIANIRRELEQLRVLLSSVKTSSDSLVFLKIFSFSAVKMSAVLSAISSGHACLIINNKSWKLAVCINEITEIDSFIEDIL